MEVKSIDALLNELNNVQLSKESMQCINGGDSNECYCSPCQSATGEVIICRRDSDLMIIKITLKGNEVTASQLTAAGDSHS